MKHLIITLIVFFFVQSIYGQNDSLIIPVNFEIEFENPCDSIIGIRKHGKIDYKLIYVQTMVDFKNKNFIIIPDTKIAKENKSILFSNHPRLSKTILEIGYDTCILRDFYPDDSLMIYEPFFISNISSNIPKDWKVNIKSQQMYCIDTDYHELKVSKDENNFVDFSCLHNIEIIEIDSNDDGENEIFIISYIRCSSEMRIYRINAS
jgi:hypothetical protein